MLILTRRIGETVMIGEDIAITVLRVKGNQVRLGVDAPKSVSVQRQEIHQRSQNGDGPVADASEEEVGDGAASASGN